MALVIIDAQLFAALIAPEAILMPNQTLGFGLLHLKYDFFTAATIRIRLSILSNLIKCQL